MNKEQLKKLEADLWRAADSLRANSDLKASEYSTPVLGLIFLANSAKSEGQGGGEFFTPRSVVTHMVEITGPHGGKPPAPPSSPA